MSSDSDVAFAETYASARARFREAALAAGAWLESVAHPAARGPQGETLTFDVAWRAPARATRWLVMISGTHGSEGLAASALLTQAWQAGVLSPRDDVGVLMVHALNPYGFAHLSRTNENNVDLNRNFLDFAQGVPANPGYAELHDDLCIDPESAAAREAAGRIAAWRDQHGQSAYMAALFNGQYAYPDGLLYGGQQPEWSAVQLEHVLRRHLQGARHVAFIDWHTGLGEYGKPFFLCFNPAGSETRRQCQQWWGIDRIEHQAGFDGGARPQYAGLVFQGVERIVAPARMAGAVIEFGTTPPDQTIQGLQRDRWLRLHGDRLAPVDRQRLQTLALESFCPSDPVWRANVMREGLIIMEQAWQGIAAWSSEESA